MYQPLRASTAFPEPSHGLGQLSARHWEGWGSLEEGTLPPPCETPQAPRLIYFALCEPLSTSESKMYGSGFSCSQRKQLFPTSSFPQNHLLHH